MKKVLKDRPLINKNAGGNYPYIIKKKAHIFYSNDFKVLANSNYLESNHLDATSVYSMLSFGYIVGDSTLIKGVSRLPWRSSLDFLGNYSYFDYESYNTIDTNEKKIAKSLLEKMKKDLREVAKNKKNIYILISGGLDSRVIAAVIKNLEEQNEISATIHGVTWGKSNSIDVNLAKRICDKYNWEWHYAPLDEKRLLINFETAAIDLGAEISPVHLHRYDWFMKNTTKEDLVIAGSYGDGIGKAEYSSIKVGVLEPLKARERYSFFKSPYNKLEKANLNTRLNNFRNRYSGSENKKSEYEMQAHYMRRMLGNVANIISKWTNFHQAFINDHIAELMFNATYDVRLKNIYNELFKLIDPWLIDLSLNEIDYENRLIKKNEALQKNHHSYGFWLRNNCNEFIKEKLFNETLENIGIFDMKQMKTMYNYWLKEPENLHTRLGDRLSWLATLSIYYDNYNVSNLSLKEKESRIDLEKYTSRVREEIFIISKKIRN